MWSHCVFCFLDSNPKGTAPPRISRFLEIVNNSSNCVIFKMQTNQSRGYNPNTPSCHPRGGYQMTKGSAQSPLTSFSLASPKPAYPASLSLSIETTVALILCFLTCPDASMHGSLQSFLLGSVRNKLFFHQLSSSGLLASL